MVTQRETSEVCRMERRQRCVSGIWRWAIAVAMVACMGFAPGEAWADDAVSVGSEESGGRGDLTLNAQFDGWVLSMEEGAPTAAYICGELPMGGRWSFVTCGSGSGVLYQPTADVIDLTHFRTTYSWSPAGAVSVGSGVGMAEVQRGQDDPGFVFDLGRQPRAVEASGPEVAVEVEWSPDTSYGAISQVSVAWDAGVAWIPGAPLVVPGASETVPFTTFSLNGRF
jgi:hypothetical protein